MGTIQVRKVTYRVDGRIERRAFIDVDIPGRNYVDQLYAEIGRHDAVVVTVECDLAESPENAQRIIGE